MAANSVVTIGRKGTRHRRVAVYKRENVTLTFDTDPTNSIGQSTCEADSRSASHEIFHILLKIKVHCGVNKNSPLDCTLSQMNPIHSLFILRSILTVSSHLCLGFPGGLFPSYFQLKLCSPIHFSSPHSCYMSPRPPWSDPAHSSISHYAVVYNVLSLRLS
jgi:hypothetical protein